ncbi:MAG: glutathione S-transferase family protein [Pseudorhodoplanes sp.]|nr:glutathione S-transferase family protein [Pseudorhodoplanes sp.]
MGMKLIVGNKNYSSWSMRPWIAMRVFGIDFTDEVIPLYQPGSREKILAHSPSGKVPCLIDGDIAVWETLAILDYLADKFPNLPLWPKDMKARAMARAISSEMHAGFAPLRNHLPMNMRRDPKRPRDLTPDVEANVERIDAIWSGARAQFGKDGPFLFGAFTNADAMYAPVVSRFASYNIKVGEPSRRYMDAVMALPAWKEWEVAGLAEPWIMQNNEV